MNVYLPVVESGVPDMPLDAGLSRRAKPPGGPGANRAGRSAQDNLTPRDLDTHTPSSPLSGDALARCVLRSFNPHVGIGFNTSRLIVGDTVVYER